MTLSGARTAAYESARASSARPGKEISAWPTGSRRSRFLVLRQDPNSWIRVLADMIEQKIRENSDFGRQPSAVLVGDVHREQRQFPVRQDWHELAGRNVILHDVERLDQDAEAPESRAADHLAVIAIERRRDPNNLLSIALTEPQRVRIVCEVVDQHVVTREIGWMFRPGVARKIGRCCRQHAPHLANASDDDVGVRLLLPRPDRDVDASLDEIGIA